MIEGPDTGEQEAARAAPEEAAATGGIGPRRQGRVPRDARKGRGLWRLRTKTEV